MPKTGKSINSNINIMRDTKNLILEIVQGQYSCLETPMDWVIWQTTVQRIAKSQTWLKRLSRHACMHEFQRTKVGNNVLILLETMVFPSVLRTSWEEAYSLQGLFYIYKEELPWKIIVKLIVSCFFSAVTLMA